MVEKKFRKLALGGTFDILHKGHHKTLDQAFKLSEKVMIGLASDRLAEKIKKKHQIASYKERKKALEKFLQKKNIISRAEINPLEIRYGVAHRLEDLNAILVSSETYSIALEINKVRNKNNLKSLNIIILSKLEAENGKPISSTRIRAGEIDVEGHILKKT